MAVTKAQVGAHVDGVGAFFVEGLQVIGEQQAHIVSLTDSTTGTATNTCNDTTVGTKDDLASIIAKIQEIIVVLETHGLTASA